MTAHNKFQARVAELTAMGHGPAAIVVRTRRCTSDVLDAIYSINRRQKQQEGRDKRTCLRCREPFKSEWAGNRLCPKCRLFAGRAAVAMD